MLQVNGSISQVQSAQRHSEHWGHFWFLHLKDKVHMEKVHTQATAMLNGTEELLYQEGLESP